MNEENENEIMSELFENKYKLIAIICIVTGLILFLMGYLLGYFLYNTDDELHPLIAGIKDVNKDNRAYFQCTCMNTLDRRITFSFDEEKIHEAYLYSD